MISHLSQAFILGLSMGPACLGYCAPVCFPLLGCGQQTKVAGTARLLGVFLLGRLAGYSLIGVVIGLAGSFLFRNMSEVLWAALRVLMGILLIVFGLQNGATGIAQRARPRERGKPFWFATSLGVLTGLNLCPPFGAAIIGAAATASVPDSLVYFWAFFAGTTICFIPLFLIGPLTKMEPFRQAARVSAFLAGAWLILQGGDLILAKIWMRGH
jgi:sulfite exporter TauE/SafE